MSEPTKPREIATAHGRAYQRYEGSAVVRIDWTPPAPLAGHRALTGGTVEDHPKEGTIVGFVERSGRQRIAVRVTPDRGTLGELVGLARSMQAELAAEVEAEKVRREADREARLAADIVAFESTLPAGYVAIEDVEHNPDAADGWGSTTYRHGGVELSERDIHGLEPRYHRAPGNAYDLLAYVPADRLADLVGRKRAEAAAKDEARAAKRSASEADRAAKIEEARASGRAVELARWTEPCDGSACECSTDIMTRYALPDGTVTTRRSHTH